MNIYKQTYFPALKSLADHVLHGVDLGGELHGRPQPLAVKVVASERASVVASDHTIRVEHWHDLKHVAVP